MKILQSKVIYKNFYSKLFVTEVTPAYIILLSKVYVTEDGAIYLEGQNMENKSILNTLEEQKKILQDNFEDWKIPKKDCIGNLERAIEFIEDKLKFLDEISGDFRRI